MTATPYTLVEYMPACWRASHDAAGNAGVFPLNGAERVWVHEAVDAKDLDPRWSRIVRVQMKAPPGEEIWPDLPPEAYAPATHWGYGSGASGCLYDNGPYFAETQERAIEAVLAPFAETGDETDLSEAELEQARADLRECHTHYFPSERRGELGADLVQIWQEDGPCPDNEY